MAFELREQSFSQVKARWETALQQQLDKGEWAEIPQPMLALTAPGKSTTGSEKAKARSRKLVRHVVNTPAAPIRRPGRGKLLDASSCWREADADQVSMAREALAHE
jgi:hypothetical protein